MSYPLHPLIIDAGARYGLHPSWQELKDLCEFHLFDIDQAECERLQNKYKNHENIKIHHLGLSRNKEIHEYNEFSHKALNSLFEVQQDSISKIDHMTVEFEVRERHSIKLDTVDNVFKEEKAQFLKLDVEGSELDVLCGAEKQLKNNILGVRSEVSFRRVFKNAPMFADINDYLSSYGFELVNLEYDGKGIACSPYTLNDKYGYLVSTDGIWIKDPEIIFAEKNLNLLAQNIIYLSVFLFQNKATDVAFQFLIKGLEKGINFSLYQDNPLFRYLERKALILLKELSYSPQFSYEQLDEMCIKIFGYHFPKAHMFYEKMDTL